MNSNQITNGFIAHSKELDHIFESFPGTVYCKDKEGRYLAANRVMSYVNCVANPADILGKKDSDLVWHKEAPIVFQHDQEVIYAEKSNTFLEPGTTSDNKLQTFFSHKFPLRNKANKIIGIFGMSTLFNDAKTMRSWLYESGFLTPPQALSQNIPAINEGLTERQMDCLFFLIQGMTMKQIATSLNLAPKTIEHYLEAIKQKLGCRSRTELISKALQIANIRSRL